VYFCRKFFDFIGLYPVFGLESISIFFDPSEATGFTYFAEFRPVQPSIRASGPFSTLHSPFVPDSPRKRGRIDCIPPQLPTPNPNGDFLMDRNTDTKFDSLDDLPDDVPFGDLTEIPITKEELQLQKKWNERIANLYRDDQFIEVATRKEEKEEIREERNYQMQAEQLAVGKRGNRLQFFGILVGVGGIFLTGIGILVYFESTRHLIVGYFLQAVEFFLGH
jgi:hypothetical protein